MLMNTVKVIGAIIAGMVVGSAIVWAVASLGLMIGGSL